MNLFCVREFHKQNINKSSNNNIAVKDCIEHDFHKLKAHELIPEFNLSVVSKNLCDSVPRIPITHCE